MKKMKLLGLASLLTLTLMGCQNTSDREAALEDQVAQLEQQITSLEKENQQAVSSGESTSVDKEGTKGAEEANAVSSTDDTLDTLTKAVDDIVKKSDAAKADASREENQKKFFELKGELKDIENRLERYEDKIEHDFHQGNLTYEKARDEEIKIEKLEDKLDNAEDRLENVFGYDD